MEPVMHLLTGACLSRSGLNRRAAYTTLAMVIAAELPDIDTLWSLRGPVAGFQHHRGITHTFLGIPFEAAIVVGAIYLVHRWRVAKHSRPQPSNRPPKRLTAVSVNWGLLYLFTLLALLSHLFLDFTNNYGLRPFFPFNPHWYAASIVFIFDPLIFLLLLAAVVLPAIFRLVGSEVGVRRQPFAARGWAIAALLAVAALWGLRETQHAHALQIAQAQTVPAPHQESQTTPPPDDGTAAPPDAPLTLLQPQRVLASPDILNPFRWHTATDFGPLFQLAEVNTRLDTSIPNQATQPRLAPSPQVLAAQATPLGRAYFDWSPMPFVTLVTPGEDAATTVLFTDPRFMGGTPLMNSSGHAPLTAQIDLDARNRVLRQSLDGRVQH